VGELSANVLRTLGCGALPAALLTRARIGGAADETLAASDAAILQAREGHAARLEAATAEEQSERIRSDIYISEDARRRWRPGAGSGAS